jgi:hypothetical protein
MRQNASGTLRFGVSADDEFLLLVEFDFDPCSSAFSRLIPGAAAFTNQTSSPSVRARSTSSGISLVKNLLSGRGMLFCPAVQAQGILASKPDIGRLLLHVLRESLLWLEPNPFEPRTKCQVDFCLSASRTCTAIPTVLIKVVTIYWARPQSSSAG